MRGASLTVMLLFRRYACEIRTLNDRLHLTSFKSLVYGLEQCFEIFKGMFA